MKPDDRDDDQTLETADGAAPTESTVSIEQAAETEVQADVVPPWYVPATEDDERFMRAAIEEAERAALAGEVPVGAVVVVGGEIVERASNLRETTQDPAAHAELIAVRNLAMRTGSWRQNEATVYVTLEPCPMCAGAMVNARIGRVVWGCDDPKAGATSTLFTIGADARLNHRFAMTKDVLRDECAAPLKRFFGAIREARRAAKAKKPPESL